MAITEKDGAMQKVKYPYISGIAIHVSKLILFYWDTKHDCGLPFKWDTCDHLSNRWEFWPKAVSHWAQWV